VNRRSAVIVIVVAACILVFGFFCLMLVFSITGEGGMAEFGSFGPRVAVIEVYGEIVDSRDFVRQVKRWTDDGSVEAIVLDINSPGGGVAASQEMYEQVLKARQSGKVVVASMGSVAASGAYLVACAADKIMANPGSLTGSIGTIMSFPTAQKLFDKIGLRWETVKSGELKDVGAMSKPMTPEEERMLRSVIDDSYEQFVEAVATGRDRGKAEIYPLADGSIFTGRQAHNFGLVDTLGTYEDAISLAGELAGIGPEPDVVKERKRRPGVFDLLNGWLEMANRVVPALDTNGPALKYLYR
jgi:protease-4